MIPRNPHRFPLFVVEVGFASDRDGWQPKYIERAPFRDVFHGPICQLLGPICHLTRADMRVRRVKSLEEAEAIAAMLDVEDWLEAVAEKITWPENSETD
jgi:hypothetical protein